MIGRVVFTASALPAVQPVNYLLDGEEIVFRTRNGSKLAAAARNAVVGFRADEFDVATRTGCCVLGIGHAYEVRDPDRLTGLAATLTDPWVPAHDAHTIAIPLRRLSGGGWH